MSFEYQDAGVAFLQKWGRALLADHPGLGKSRQALLAAEGRTLIVAPASVLAGQVWADEIAKWRPDLDATCVAYSSITGRVKTGTTASSSKPLPVLRPEYRGRWDTVILDEMHYVKGRKTTWTKAILKLQTDRLYLLSGTPIPSWAHELWVPLCLMFPEQAVGGGRLGSFWRWAGEWFVVFEKWGARQISHLRPDRTWEQFHHENFQGRFLQRLRDDVLTDLPPLTIQTELCPMSPAHAKLYKQLKRDFIAWTESGVEVVAWSSAAQVVKLAKLCTDISVIDPTAKRAGKYEHLRQRLESQARPSMVVGHFRDTVWGAQQVAADAGLSTAVIMGGMSGRDLERAVRGFQAGEIDVLCATIDKVSEGLTLTAADTVHRLERSWRPSRNEQVIRRIHRIGQLRPVTVVDYITPGSIDQRILKVLAEKTDQQLKALRPSELVELL